MSDDQKIDDVMAFDGGSDFVAAETDPATPSTTEQDASGMDQLRGLVLGPLAGELQTKMTQLGQRLDGSMLELDRRTSDRVSEMETRFKDRLDGLTAEIAELQERQAATLKSVRDELAAGTSSLTEKMELLTTQTAQERAVEIQAIRGEFEQLSDSITSRLDCEAEVLRSELVDRDSLSAALSEVAMRLSSESEIIVADTPAAEMDLDAAIDAVARQG